MPNSYYNYNNDLIPGTRARSLELDDQFNALEAAFDKLVDADSLQGGGGIVGTDSGSVNQYALTTVVNNPVPFNLQLVSFAPLNTNTGAATIALDGGTQYSVKRNDGSDVQAGDMIAGIPALYMYDLPNTRWIHIGATDQQTKAENRPNVVEDATTARTLAASDEASIIRFSNAAAVTVTVPNDASIPVGFIVHLYQEGAGQVTASASGVTIRSGIGNKTRVQYASISLTKVSSTQWNLVGDAAA